MCMMLARQPSLITEHPAMPLLPLSLPLLNYFYPIVCFDCFTMNDNMTIRSDRVSNRCDKQGQYKFKVYINNKVVRKGYDELVIKAYSSEQSLAIFNLLCKNTVSFN